MNKPTEFERLCLAALWVLIRLAAGQRSLQAANDWRASASEYLKDTDELGPL